MALISNAWTTLSNYESQDLIRDRYRIFHNRSANAAHCREIRSSIVQARGYFESAQQADRAVRPLLLYYGVVGLARALIMFLAQKREAALAPSHGLTAKDWQAVFSHQAVDLGAVPILINSNGTLPEFAGATKHSTHLKLNSSSFSLSYPHGPLATGTEICLDDLLSRLPELGNYYWRWRKHANVLRCDVGQAGNLLRCAAYKNQFGEEVGRSYVESFFEGTPIAFVEESDGNYAYGGAITFSKMPPLTDHYGASFGLIGELSIIKPLQIGREISKPILTFMISYAFGMLARYYPSRWVSLMNGEAGDAGLPTILRAIDFIEQYFPEMVLSFLESRLNEVDRGFA